MPSENLDVVLGTFRLFEAGEFEGWAALWHPESRVTGPEDWPEPGPFEGRDAVVAQFRRLASDWGENRLVEGEVVADRDGWVVLEFVWEVRGAGSGAAVASQLTGAYHLEDGTITEGHFRWTTEEALEAAGLGGGEQG